MKRLVACIAPSSYTVFESVAPKRLKKTVNSLQLMDDEIIESKFKTIWSRIIKKIESGRKLSRRDKKRVLLYFENLKPAQENKFRQLFLNGMDREAITEIAKVVINSLRPIKAISFLCEEQILSQFGQEHLGSGVARHIEAFHTADPKEVERDFLDQYFDIASILTVFCCDFENIPATLKGIVGIMLMNDINAKFLSSDPDQLLLDGFKLFGVERFMTILDQVAGHFITLNPEWAAQIFSNDYPLNRLAIYLEGHDELKEHFSNNLIQILREYQLVNTAIEKLSSIAKIRGDFWQNNIKKCNKLIAQENRSVYALAMYFGKYVIVEHAPTGNAAYVYLSIIFDEKVKSLKDWKQKGFSEKKFSRIPYKKRFFRGRGKEQMFTKKDGTIAHVGNWQNKIEILVKYMIKGE